MKVKTGCLMIIFALVVWLIAAPRLEKARQASYGPRMATDTAAPKAEPLAKKTPEKKEPPKLPPFNVGVGFTGTQFAIVNLNDFDMLDVSLYIDPGFLESGYSCGVARIKKKDMVSIGAMLFQKDNGSRFNPFTQEPRHMKVTCRDRKGNDHWAFEMIRAIR